MAKADIAHAVQQLVREKASLAAKERSLIHRLNAGLRQIGYQVVSVRDGATRALASTGKRRGMSAAARKAVSQRMTAYWAKRKAAKVWRRGTTAKANRARVTATAEKAK